MLKKFQVEGVEVTENVMCVEPVTIGSTTYYRGYLSYICSPAITEEGYGLVENTTQLDILLNGMPESETEVGLDMLYGHIFATEVKTIQATYLAYGPTPEPARSLKIDTAWLWPTGETTEVSLPVSGLYRIFACDCSYDVAPDSEVTLTISNGTDEEELVFSTQGSYPLRLNLVPTQELTVSGDGKNCVGLILHFVGV